MRLIRSMLTMLVAVLAAGASAGLAQADQLPKIRVGWVVSPPDIQPVMFAKKGITRHLDKTYTLDSMHFKGTPPMITALASGQLDIAVFTFSTLGFAIQNAGINDLRIIADKFVDGEAGYFTEPFLVLKSSGINKVEDIKGKVVATNALGSGNDIAMRVMLKRHGLVAQRDYTVIEAGFPSMKAILLEGKASLVTAAVLTAYDPKLNEAAKTLFTEHDAMGPTQFAVWATRQGFIQKNRAALVDMLEDSLRALHWYLDPKNHDEAIKILADFTKQPPKRFSSWLFTKKDYYRNLEGLPNMTALQSNLDTAQEMGFLKKRLDISQYTDLSLVKEAAQKLK